ncbi:hypothetical protein NCS57_00363800 [Fusarium keratoplasticum]|uniref:Uncharacterized protein n=1 Tax=Fusarium keratoplasticum TaxID=1328300 RepID=A0ACC0R6R1_9HYPO|nr:hypothetical protein NCS57_00363800 [Fusarium keratoplasticum]KAI8674651.1 hypothetical protein NCS57_00363800 [Fusarium keratoplasticum]
MVFAKIYTYPGNYRVQRVKVAAELNGLEVVDAEGFKMGVTNREPEFLAKFPQGKVPALETPDGFCLAENIAICRFIADSGPAADQLNGADVRTKAQINEWVAFCEAHIAVPMNFVAGVTVYKYIPQEEGTFNMMVAQFEKGVQRVEAALAGGKEYLVGEQVTLADIMVFGALSFSLSFLFDEEKRSKVPGTVRYLKALSEQPAFKNAFGELKI